jgi:putative flippase GtrA
MTTASFAAKAATGSGPVAAFVRFVVCGGGVTLAASALLLLVSGPVPFVVANALVTVVSTVVTTELHARVSFRSEQRGWRCHLKSAGTVAVSYLFTTAAVMVLHLLVAAPGVLVEQAVYLGACGLAGIGRFVVLRLVVFASGAAGAAGAVSAAERELSRGSVVMAA